MNLNTKVIIPETLLIQEVDNEIILLDTNTQEYFTLSEVGKDIFEELSKNTNLNDLCNNLVNKYDVNKSQIEHDLLIFIKALVEKELIEIS